MMHGVFARVFVRSTEDPEKVLRALQTVVPLATKKNVKVTEHRGVYGNLFYSITYEGRRKEAKKVWEHVWRNLDPEDREFLKERIEEFVDEWGNLHLRFDKQDAYRGKLRLGQSGVVKLVFKLEAYPAKPEKFREIARKLVEK
ncbi:MAG: exosome subunit [Candidatus Diapherotrites archaeon]|nr:exosome subunit [Candidatus Diapherotrites archaeon]